MRNKKVISVIFGCILCTTLFVENVNCARKSSSSSSSRRGSGNTNSGSTNSRTSAPNRYPTTGATAKPQMNSHSYSQSDASKLTYSNNYNPAPKPQQPSAPVQAPPSYTANQGPPPVYSYPGQNAARPNVHEPPPAYQPQPGLGSGHLAPQYPSQQQPGFQQPGFQQPGFQQPGFQQPGYQQPGFQQPGFQQPGVQPHGYQVPPGYHTQPNQPINGYPMQPGYQQPQVINNYHTPQQSSSGSGLQTALLAGVGGLALYGALKPGDTKYVYINNGTNEQGHPVNVEHLNNATGPSTPTPLAPMPQNPNQPIMQPQPVPMGPMMPVQQNNGMVYDPVSNTMVNCTALLMQQTSNMNIEMTTTSTSEIVSTSSTTPSSTSSISVESSTASKLQDESTMMNTQSAEASTMSSSTMEHNMSSPSMEMNMTTETNNITSSTMSSPPMQSDIVVTPQALAQLSNQIPAVCMMQNPSGNMQNPQTNPMMPISNTNVYNNEYSNVPLAQYPTNYQQYPVAYPASNTQDGQQQPVLSAVQVDPNSNSSLASPNQSAKISQEHTPMSATQNADGKSSAVSFKISIVALLIPLLMTKKLLI